MSLYSTGQVLPPYTHTSTHMRTRTYVYTGTRINVHTTPPYEHVSTVLLCSLVDYWTLPVPVEDSPHPHTRLRPSHPPPKVRLFYRH